MDHTREDAAPQERIVAAALSLIATEGFNGVTMTAIARSAGVARQTLYNHYPDVESIVSSAVAAHQAASLGRLDEVLATVATPEDKLEHLVRHVAATAAHGHPTLRQGFSTSVQEIIDEYDRALRSHVQAILEEGAAGHRFRSDLDPARDSLVVQRMIEATGELVAADAESAPATVAAVVATVQAAVLSR